MWVENFEVIRFPYPEGSSSLWGCELKIKGSDCTCISFRSSSLWGCELKNVIRFYRQYEDESSSLWGCELKNVLISPWSIPPHRHPPCEDVSWKGCECEYCDDENVILLVRMWVEKMAGWFLFPLSIRHPPCEDVSWKINWCAFPRGGACHPPCEDVSWKLAHTMNLICPLCHPPCEDVSWKTDLISIM